MKKLLIVLSIVLFSCLAYSNLNEKAPVLEGPRPNTWAVLQKKEGLGNFHKINDWLYRGEQPEKTGVKELEKLGIKTVINLRQLSVHGDKEILEGTQIKEKRIHIFTGNFKDEYAVEFLKTINDKSQRPIFFHCLHGADRTGTMCALYRICMEGWDKEEAIREMQHGGYGNHTIFTNLIRYIREVDVAELKKKAGLK